MFFVVLMVYALVTGEEGILLLGEEDGPIEWFGALAFLSSAVLFLFLYLKNPSGNDFAFFRTRRNIFFLAFAVVFFFAAGEEISWGQRIFQFDAPASIINANRQGEFNFHNLDLFHNVDYEGQKRSILRLFLNLNFLFNLFCLGYCVLIPLMNRYIKPATVIIRKIRLPVVPLWLGFLFLASIVVFEIAESMVIRTLQPPVYETKEGFLAFLFLIAALYWYMNLPRKKIASSGP